VDFGGLLVLGIVWLLFNLIGQGKKGTRPAPRTSPPREPAPSGPAAPGGSGDPTQREGSRLEQLLRELERNLEGVAGTQSPSTPRLPVPKRVGASRLPPEPMPPEEEEDVEERDSLEEPERVISLETDVPRRQRVVYDQDADAEALVHRRIEAARDRDRALSKVDHKAFDARIRQEPAEHTAVRRYTTAQLRDAVVWREILGPPVSEREP
jgi:hypothetical protein